MRTIETTTRHAGQNHGMIVIETHGELRMRYTVDLDTSFREQSRVLSEVWTANGWAEVVRLFALDPTLDKDYVAVKLSNASPVVKKGHGVTHSADVAFNNIITRLRDTTVSVVSD